MQSFGLDTGPQLLSHSFIALSITHYSKSAQKFAVWVRQVTTVAMATTQLVLNQLHLSYKLRTKQRLSLPKMISKCCELVKLCHIIRSGPVFFESVYIIPTLLPDNNSFTVHQSQRWNFLCQGCVLVIAMNHQEKTAHAKLCLKINTLANWKYLSHTRLQQFDSYSMPHYNSSVCHRQSTDRLLPLTSYI